MGIFKKKIWGQASVLAASLLGLASAAQAITPATMSIRTGDLSGNVKALAVSDEGRVVKLYTDRVGNLNISFAFNGVGTEQALEARFNQKSDRDKFTFQVMSASGAYVDLGVTTGRGYRSLRYSIPSTATGTIQIRLISSRGADDAELDQLLVLSKQSVPPTTPPVQPPPPPVTPPPVVVVPPVIPPPLPPVTPPTPPPVVGQLEKLPVGISWYWQLQGAIKPGVNAMVYDIDLFDTSAETIASLKNQGRAVVCYFSAGTYENWRSDAKNFAADSLGANMEDWPGERWLDVRKPSVATVMAARLDLAKSKGCDAVEPDNVDGYSNKNGVGLTKADQITYNALLADLAHARGLLVSLKNSTDLVGALVNKFDFAVVEECFAYNECDAYTPFVMQGKAVLNAEYSNFSAATCTKAKQLGLSTAFFNLNLDGKVFNPCP